MLVHLYMAFQATFDQDHTEHDFLTLSSYMFMLQLNYVANTLHMSLAAPSHFFQLL